MENKELMVTIPLEDYDNLKRAEFILDEIDSLVNECIKNAIDLSWDKESLKCEYKDVERLLRYMNKAGYDKKMEELKNNE